MPRPCLVTVNYKLAVREQDALRGLFGAYLEGVVDRVPEETLLMPGADVAHDHMTLIVAPHDFTHGEAFADGVKEVGHDVLHALDAAELGLHELGDLFVSLVIRVEGDDLEVEARDRVLPGL
ncbi:hypothetical protein SDC9_78869 [bioreactor metagenome]|uniref:Uncharacterized protein n=1 Tax=bioreactor metagenome TaxID=1076179 RepID=A0A644YVD4_9ZZZZ